MTDQPRKRPKAYKRFERDVPNDLWQIDATRTHLQDGTEVWIVDALDDHARFLLAARACVSPSTAAAWAFEEAAARHGMPRQLLSDNGLCFTGRLHGRVVDFERRIRSLGIVLINSGPYHPETLGKLERFHKTMKEWLKDEGRPGTWPICRSCSIGSGLTTTTSGRSRGSVMPSRPSVTDPALPCPRPTRSSRSPSNPRGAIIRTVWRNGVVTYDRRNIGLGKRWAGLKVRIVPAGKLIHVYYGKILVRSLAFDPELRYQRQVKPEREVIGRR